MKIGIDMASTVGRVTGLGIYTRECFCALTAMNTTHTFIPITTIKKNLRTPYRILWDQIGLPLVAFAKSVDALFIPAFSAPHFSKPVVATAHDIFGVIHPEQFASKSARFYWTRVLPNSLKHADRLIAISEYTKRGVVEHCGISEDRIDVIPLSADHHFRRLDDGVQIASVLKRFGIAASFILTVGTQEPRKNYVRLIEAFASARRGATQLVIVGKMAHATRDIQQVITKYHLHNVVHCVDYIRTTDLVALYNACLFFVMPSLYEGFGLPALEAMCCGAPVLVSQTTSLPEVVGDAGMLFDPYDVSAMRDRMNTLFDDDERRRIMQRKSLMRSTQFSWETTAAKTIRVFEKL